MSRKPRTKEVALKAIKSKAAQVSRFMNSPIGRQVIHLLELEFPGGVGKDPHLTYKNLGNREPIEYLKQLQRINEREDQHEEIQPKT